MNHVQSEYYNIFYDDVELYASRIGEPCVLPRLAFSLPTLINHKNIGLLSVLLYQEEGESKLSKCQMWPFPFACGTLVDLEVAQYEFKFALPGKKFYVLTVTDIGKDLLNNTPTSFLVHNLIRCSTDFSDDLNTDWVKAHYFLLPGAIEFFLRKLFIADLPEFLTHEQAETRQLAKEALDASVQ